MKRILFLFTLLAHAAAFGQDSSATRNREFYVTLADFSPLNIHLKYKHPIGERTYLKFGLVNLSARTDKSSSNFTSSNYSAGAEVGIEFRSQLSYKLTLFHGPNLRYTYNQLENGNMKFMGHTASIPYTVGLMYKITPELLIAAEVNPAISYMRTESSGGNNSDSYIFSFDNRGGLLSLALRF